MSRELAEQKALEQYRALEGKIVRVRHLVGYTNRDFSEDVDGDFVVRIEKTGESDILRWMDEWLDPAYDVTVLQPPDTPRRSCWIWGESHHEDGEKSQPGDVLEVLVAFN